MTELATTVEVDVVDRTVEGPHGDLKFRTYVPLGGARPTAGFVWCHGGAFAFGDLDMPEADWVSRQIAGSGIPVVSVDYRRAPVPAFLAHLNPDSVGGHHFPVASEEVSFLFGWAVNSGEFGVSTDRWSLGGASAGANLSAGATLRLRDEHATLPRSLVLAYPVLHAVLPEHRPELETKVLDLPAEARFPPEFMEQINLNYVGDVQHLDSPYAFPGSHDLHGLPPTFILNSDSDALRSSGESFASELTAAGVDVLQIREDGTLHGHLNEPENPAAGRSISRILAWLTVDALVGTSHERSR